jgi:hypothetical protein
MNTFVRYIFVCLLLSMAASTCYSKEEGCVKKSTRYSIKFILEISDARKIEIKNRIAKKYHLGVTMPNQTEYRCISSGSYIRCRIMQCRLGITDMFKKNISIYNMKLIKGIKHKWVTPEF